MKTRIALLTVIFGLMGWSSARPGMKSDNQSECCQMVQEALGKSREIKPGATRREVEKNWTIDGGVHIRDEARYNYSKCEYIKVDIDFKRVAPTDQIEDSPDDLVTKVSKPFLAYPAAD